MQTSELKQRLAALQAEYETGQKMLAELDAKRVALSNTMLRIEGAMQVLRELLGEAPADAAALPTNAPGADGRTSG